MFGFFNSERGDTDCGDFGSWKRAFEDGSQGEFGEETEERDDFFTMSGFEDRFPNDEVLGYLKRSELEGRFFTFIFSSDLIRMYD